MTADEPASERSSERSADAVQPVPDRPVPMEPTLDDLPWLVDQGLRMVRRRRQASDLGIYGSIENQLSYVRTRVDIGQRPPDDVLETLTLGIYAAREFETSDPPFADVLFAVEYLAKRM